MKHMGLILTIVIVLASDAMALIFTARNRARDAVETITLTERELPRMTGDLETTGVDLRFNWNQFRVPPDTVHFDQAQLEAAGFVFKAPPGEATRNIAFLPREAFVAFELEGPKWQEWQELREKARQMDRDQSTIVRSGQNLEQNSNPSESHLFVADASESFSELRNRYPDQSKNVIVRAVISARTQLIRDPDTGATIAYKYVGRVLQVLPDIIHVPLPYARSISSLKPQTGTDPRYTVTLKYGNNLEPWVTAVTLR